MEGIKIRRMTHDDLREVLNIENTCSPAPWSENSFKYEIDNRETILKVAVLHGKIAGYVCLRTILDITHVLNIKVLPEFRRRSIGTLLLGNALKELKILKPDFESVTLEVRESNSSAIELYKKFGFKVTGKRIGYYKQPPENAVIMELRQPEVGASKRARRV